LVLLPEQTVHLRLLHVEVHHAVVRAGPPERLITTLVNDSC
jgi:hypothetical protein